MGSLFYFRFSENLKLSYELNGMSTASSEYLCPLFCVQRNNLDIVRNDMPIRESETRRLLSSLKTVLLVLNG